MRERRGFEARTATCFTETVIYPWQERCTRFRTQSRKIAIPRARFVNYRELRGTRVRNAKTDSVLCLMVKWLTFRKRYFAPLLHEWECNTVIVHWLIKRYIPHDTPDMLYEVECRLRDRNIVRIKRPAILMIFLNFNYNMWCFFFVFYPLQTSTSSLNYFR